MGGKIKMELSWVKNENETIPGVISGYFLKEKCCLVFQSLDNMTKLALKDCRLEGITTKGIVIKARVNEPDGKKWYEKTYVYKDFYFIQAIIDSGEF